MPKKCPTYAQDILRYVDDESKIFPRYATKESLAKISPKYASGVRYAQDMPKIFLRYAKDFKNLNDLLTHFVSNMDPKDASASKKLRQKNTSAIRFSSFPRSTGEVKSWELMTDLGGKGQSLINRY